MTTEKKYKIGVYGSLRKGLHNYLYFLKNKGKYLGEFRTKPEYTLITLGQFPGLLEGGNTPVHMEVYEVNKEQLKEIDSLEGWNPNNPEKSMYIKKEISSPYGKISIYIYNIDSKKINSKDIVKSGNWTNYKLNKQENYV